MQKWDSNPMLTHDQIWTAIDRLAQAHGYSPSGLAKKAGLDPTTFNKSKRVSADGKPRWPSTESIAKILSVTGATMLEFLSGSGDEDGSTPVAVRKKDGEVLTGVMTRQNKDAVRVQASGSGDTREIPRGEIDWIAHIIFEG